MTKCCKQCGKYFDERYQDQDVCSFTCLRDWSKDNEADRIADFNFNSKKKDWV